MDSKENLFGVRLKKLRKSKGFSQEELAKKIGLNKSSIFLYENKTQNPNSKVIIKMCKLFNISADYLLGLSDIKNISEYVEEKIKEKTKVEMNIGENGLEVEGREEFVKEQIIKFEKRIKRL